MSSLSGTALCILWFVIAVVDFLVIVLSPYLLDNFIVHKKRFAVAMILTAIVAGLCIANTGVACIFVEALIWRVLYAYTLLVFARYMSLDRGFYVLPPLCLGASIAINIERYHSATLSIASLYLAGTVFLFCGILCWCYIDYKKEKEWQAKQS